MAPYWPHSGSLLLARKHLLHQCGHNYEKAYFNNNTTEQTFKSSNFSEALISLSVMLVKNVKFGCEGFNTHCTLQLIWSGC